MDPDWILICKNLIEKIEYRDHHKTLSDGACQSMHTFGALTNSEKVIIIHMFFNKKGCN